MFQYQLQLIAWRYVMSKGALRFSGHGDRGVKGMVSVTIAVPTTEKIKRIMLVVVNLNMILFIFSVVTTQQF